VYEKGCCDHIKEDEIGRIYSTHGGYEKLIQNFGWKTEGKKPLGRPRHRWEIMSEWILEDKVGICGLDSSGSG
jgi:hypothetical protein